jgi:hypothetical protein
MAVQDVDPAVPAQRAGDERLDRRVVADIGGDRFGAAAGFADVARRGLAGRRIAVGDTGSPRRSASSFRWPARMRSCCR